MCSSLICSLVCVLGGGVLDHVVTHTRPFMISRHKQEPVLRWWCIYGDGSGVSVVVEIPLQWRHNGRDGVSNQRHPDCLLNRLFRHRSTKTSKLRVTGLCEGNSPVTGGLPSQRASNVAMCPFDDVMMRWRLCITGIGPSKYTFAIGLILLLSSARLRCISLKLIWDACQM